MVEGTDWLCLGHGPHLFLARGQLNLPRTTWVWISKAKGRYFRWDKGGNLGDNYQITTKRLEREVHTETQIVKNKTDFWSQLHQCPTSSHFSKCSSASRLGQTREHFHWTRSRLKDLYQVQMEGKIKFMKLRRAMLKQRSLEEDKFLNMERSKQEAVVYQKRVEVKDGVWCPELGRDSPVNPHDPYKQSNSQCLDKQPGTCLMRFCHTVTVSLYPRTQAFFPKLWKSLQCLAGIS